MRECHGDYRKEEDLEDPNLPLYRFQKSLPKLPVPSLKETCFLYLKTVRALVSDDEFEKTKKVVTEFIQPNGLGHVLQQRLEKRANERPNSSYLAEWWNTLGYLQVRDPVVFNVSYFFHFADTIHPEQQDQLGRAAALLQGTMQFRNKVADGSLEPERIGREKTPLCATAYKYMFNACRIPHRDQDSYRIYDPKMHNHVVVMRNNKFFTFDLVSKSGQLLSFGEIKAQLENIIASAGAKESPIGALSSQDRDSWADARDQLIHDGNETILKKIESAVVMLCLDDTSPICKSDVSRALWHGDGRNRFYDKIIQLVVFENGKAGLLAEHSMLDGMAMVVYADYIISGLHNKKIQLNMSQSNQLVEPKQLNFTFTPPTLRAIDLAQQVFDQTVANHEVFVETFWGYGKNEIKEFKCSPDAFVQMAIQLAYRKLFGCQRATYEASQVRAYLHGRTETTRSVSVECVEWVNAMVKEKSMEKLAVEKKASALRKAVASHVAYMRRAAKSHGVDRHLLALSLCLEKGESAAIFSDPSYRRSKTWHVSTSHLTHPLFDNWGWGEVVSDGVGIAYSIKNNCCQFNIACRKLRWAEPLGHCIQESLLEMKQLMQAEQMISKTLNSKL